MPQKQVQSEAAFSIADLALIFRRRILWFATPAGLGILAALALAIGLPSVYEAETTILIEPPTIHPDLVTSTVVSDKESRFQQVRLRLLARDSLSEIIEEYELYAKADTPMEPRVEQMRNETTIEPILPQIVDPRRPVEIDSVRIAFRHGDPVTSANVATSLAREFIRLNIEARSADAQGTSDFLGAELRREEQELGRVLDEIRAFREKHAGELPDQLLMNRTNLDRLKRDLARIQGDHQEAVAQVQLIQAQLQEVRSASGGEESPQQRKEMIEAALSSYRASGYTDKHPDVILAKAQLAEVERDMAERAADEHAAPAPASRLEERLAVELRNATVAAQVKAQEIEATHEEVAMYQVRIENTPKRQAELGQLEAKALAMENAIAEFRQKKARADLAKSLEAKQKGEKYRVIESAEPPESPVSPNRPLVFVIGTIAGLTVGFAALVLREVTDGRVYTISELHDTLPIPVLAAVSNIRLASEVAEMRARVRRWSLSGAAALVVTALIGGAVYFYLSAEPPPAAGAPATAGTGAGDV